MNWSASEYATYFTNDQQVKIGIKVADNKFLEVGGLVRFIEGDRLTLELYGTELAEESTVEPGSDVFITTWSGWSMCRCNALLMQNIYGRRVFLRLTGQVIEKQAREYFRIDVSIPISYTIPEKQLLPEIHEEWVLSRGNILKAASPVLRPCPDGFRVAGWNGSGDIEPQRVNLSGGGLRFKTPVYIKPETLVYINLFLPFIPPRVIHVVAETLRSNEIILGRGSSYMTALRFHFINDRDRETIIAFIFAEQRRLLGGRVGKWL